MKKSSSVIVIMLLIFVCCCTQDSEFLEFKDQYLGQQLPGITPEIFAPGVVSTKFYEHGSPVFSNDLKEIYWTANVEENGSFVTRLTYMMKWENKNWSRPVIPGILKDFEFCDYPFITPEGNKLFFAAYKVYEVNRDKSEKQKLYYSERTDSGWEFPVCIDSVVNNPGWGLSGPTVASNGTLYFTAWDQSSPIKTGFYYSEICDSGYCKPVKMDDKFKQSRSDYTPYIAKDESYFIFASMREGGFGWHDLFISFRQPDGSWGRIINMGDKINTDENERFPNLSPDGKYFFFNRSGDVYWVSAKIINELRAKK